MNERNGEHGRGGGDIIGTVAAIFILIYLFGG